MNIFTFRSILFLILLTLIGRGLGHNVQAQSIPVLAQESSTPKLYQQGLAYFETQQYHQAIETLLELIKIEPNNFEAYNTIGMSWGGLEEYSGAIVAFDRAIALNSNFANAYYNRGYVYQRLNRDDLALLDFNQTIKLTQGQHISALIDRSSIYARQAEYDLALADLHQVLELNPEEATAYYNRALINLTMENRVGYLDDLAIAEKLYRHRGDTLGLAQINRLRELYY